MNNQNRIEEIYELACVYLSLPVSARFLIGTHFRIVSDEHLVFSNKDAMDEEIFRKVFEQKLFTEFKKFTQHFKKSRSHEYGLQ